MPVTVALLGILSLLLLAYSVLDVVTTPAANVRGLPKPLWFIVLLLPVVGPALWFLVGRPAPGAGRSSRRVLPDPAPPSSNPDDDEAFLRDLRRRAEQQRREGDQQRSGGDDETPA